MIKRSHIIPRLIPFRLLFCLLLGNAALITAKAQHQPQKERNITAFCRLFGYVRYFHPSDEAQNIEWERFAIYGCRQVLSAPDDASLIDTLRKLFAPLAPSIVIYPTAEQRTFDISSLRPSIPGSFNIVSWQHLGMGSPYIDYYAPGVFSSIRLNRQSRFIPKDTVDNALLYQLFQTHSYTGAFLLTAKIRLVTSEKATCTIGLSNIETDGQSHPSGSYTLECPATDTLWHDYRLEGHITATGNSAVLGITLKGKGDLYIKEVTLRVKHDQQTLTLPLGAWQHLPYNNYSYNDSTQPIHIGYIHGQLRTTIPPLYSRRHAVGDLIHKELVSGISGYIPLAVYATAKYTWPIGDTSLLLDLKNKAAAATNGPITASSLEVRLADIVLAYNVYRHFFPYWDLASATPEDLLRTAIQRAFTDATPLDFCQTLSLMTTPLNDAHIFVLYGHDSTSAAAAPLTLEKVDDKIVVGYILDTTLRYQLRQGDIVDSIDNRPAQEALRIKEDGISGSPQWKEFKGLITLPNGRPNTSLNLVLKTTASHKAIRIPRTIQGTGYRNGGFSDHPRPSGQLGKGIYYINLFDTVDRVTPLLKELADARSIIFDLRGYPSIDIYNTLLPYLLDTATPNRNILHTPRILYPDYDSVTFAPVDDTYQPAPPRFKGNIFFLSDASSSSAAENFLGYIKAFHLGTIIGQPSSGTNGNINVIYLPGDYTLSFTGMYLTTLDGKGNHLQGIIPDIYIRRTLTGIKNGRDEIFDAALRMAAR